MAVIYNTRITQKHDTKENWDKVEDFIPLEGEIIVYDGLNKIKIGDGVTRLIDLSFTQAPSSDWNQSDETQDDYIKNKPILGALSSLDKVSKNELPEEVIYMNSEDNETIEETKEPVIDVTAQVGQTIIVKEVDANGKPTKWESADYPPVPVLLGEVVLTNENCSSHSDITIYFNEALTAQIASVHNACKNHFGTIMINVSIADFNGVLTAQYVGESSAMGSASDIQFFLIHSSDTIYVYHIYVDGLSTNHAEVLQAILVGYPMTLKIYRLQ